MVATAETISPPESRRQRFFRSGIQIGMCVDCAASPRSSASSLVHNSLVSLGLGGENPLLTMQSAALPQYSRSEVLGSGFWRSHPGNDPVNNLDPSGHKNQPPPQHTFHPPQTQPAQGPNAHVNVKTPTSQHGTTSSAERGILKQADSLGDAPSWAVPKAGEPLAGAGFGQAASGLQKMDQQEAHWLAAHHLSGPGGNTGPTVPPGARPTPYPGELSPAALQYRSPGDPNPPSYVQAIGGHLWYFPLNDKGTHTPALPPGAPPFAPPSYNGPLPPLHLPPGVNLIPGVKSFVQAKQDFNWQRYNKANQTFQLGLAAALVAVIGGVSARESDLTGLFRGSAKKAVRATFGNAAPNDYRSTFFAAHPDLEGKVIVHHAVEQQTLTRFPGAVTESEIHSLENLRGIPKNMNAEVHLRGIRREWNRFYRENPRPTKAQFLQKATEIDRLYGKNFSPPAGGHQ